MMVEILFIHKNGWRGSNMIGHVLINYNSNWQFEYRTLLHDFVYICMFVESP